VSIRNGGAANADLTGWTLSDSANHDYTFPAFTLAPNASVKVHTGSGSNSATDLFQGRGTGIWNNTGGDEATLRDASGALVDTYSY
jgi:micrococcal nuclease